MNKYVFYASCFDVVIHLMYKFAIIGACIKYIFL